MLLIACDGPTNKPPAGSDTSPSKLGVEMLVDEAGQQLTPRPPNTSLNVSIYFTLGGQSGIQFNQGETVTCGNTNLSFFLGRYQTSLSGWTNPLICNYNRSGVSTQLSAPVAPLPMPTSPTVGSTVPRSANMVVTYTPSAGSIGIRFRTDPNVAPDAVFKPETGSLVYDASQENQGASVLTLERRVKTNPATTGFKSFTSTSNSDASVLITWR